MRRIASFILICLLLMSSVSRAQQAMADSIRREINSLDKNAPDYLTKYAGSLGTLLQSLKYSDPRGSLLLCDTLHDTFMQLKDSVHAFEAKYRYKASIYDLTGQPDSMLNCLETYAEALSSINKSDGYVYLDIGNVYFGFSMFGLATENYDRAEKIFKREKNLQGLCTIYNNHAQMFMVNTLVPDSALKWLRKSYYIRANELKDEVLSHESLYLMSVVFRRAEQYDSARILLWKVIGDITSGAVDKHTDHIALRQEFSGAYTAMGIVHSAIGNADSAEYYFSRGLHLYKSSGYSNRLPGLYNAWCRHYIKEKDSSKSWTFLKLTESVTPTDNPSLLMNLYQLYADWYEWQGMSVESYMYQIKYYKLSDSLQSSNSKEQTMVVASRVLQLQDKAELERQHAALVQADLDAEQAARYRIRLIIILIALVIIAAMAIYGANRFRRNNEIIKRYNADLEAANSTKEQFLSVISHDLRSPFNALIGMSNLLRENARSGNYSNVEQNAEQINEAARKAYILLDNLMQWVSVQKESIVVKREVLPAEELIDEVLFLLKEQSLSRNLQIEKRIGVAKLNTDKTLFQVVLRNLLSNAVKYTPSGGRIIVSLLLENNDLNLIVEDNGNGFPQKELDVLMSKQQGVGIAGKAGGLGLVLVRQFVQLLGGTLNAENAATGGARVIVTLPNGGSGILKPLEAAKISQTSALTSGEKARLSETLQKLAEYELFDVTEIRTILEQPIPGETENIANWRKNVLQSVYLADESKYAELISAAKE